MTRIEYSHNNSGGSWWLEDKDWRALEKMGWDVEWERNGGFVLGARARRASKDFDTVRAAILESEEVTGLSASAEGCNCCGPPHEFSWGEGEDYDFCSGSEVLPYLYDAPARSLRDFYDEKYGGLE